MGERLALLLIVLSIVLCLITAPVLCDNHFEEKDPIWRRDVRIKRHEWAQGMKSDAHIAPAQLPAGPVVAPMRNVFCEQEVSNIGKRSIAGPMDSFPNLNNYFLNEDSSDVVLIANGTRLPAHKFVLMAKSPKFAELFKADPQKREFDLELDSEEAIQNFRAILKYFYTERFALEDESDYTKVINAYKMAQQYGMEGLKVQIERSLAKLINLNNYLDLYKFAEENQMHELVRLWMTFVFANSQQIITNESFINESLPIAQKVLSTLNAQTSYVLAKMRQLMDNNPGLDVQQFRNVVHIERCSVDDLLALADLKLFDHKFLFEDMVKRFRSLAANCVTRPVTRHVPRWIGN